MDTAATPGPEEIGALRIALAAAEADLAAAHARLSDDQARIARYRLEIAKLKRQLFGRRSERTQRLLDQMELQLEELELNAAEDENAAEQAAARTTQVASFGRKRPSRQPLPVHLPRERVVEPAPCACHACGGKRLSKLGEDITETLEVIPRQWKVIQRVREKFTCRVCEAISQAPLPFHVTPRGWAGPNFLAMLLFEKFGQHQPLHRQAERYGREGVPLSLSTLADQVGADAAALLPLYRHIETHVLEAECLHGADTVVPVLAKGATDTGRLWVYVRDDAPFAGRAPPAAVFYYSRDRKGEHPRKQLASWSGVLQADAGACPRAGLWPDPGGGFADLYAPGRQPGPVLEASCWAHGRRKVFELADVETAALRQARGETPKPVYPLALEAVRRIDALFDIEREINHLPAEQRAPSVRPEVRRSSWNSRAGWPKPATSSRAGTIWPRR